MEENNFILQGNVNLQKANNDYTYHEEDILPIGSVVEITNSNHKYMIVGYNHYIDNIRYLYVACEYPIGIQENCICFQKNQITKIFFVGMTSREENNLQKTLMT